MPALVALDDVQMPRMTDYEKWLGPVEISAVPIPHDCTDGFLYAYWRRHAAYLDPRIRAAMSSFWMLDNVYEGLQQFASDPDKSVWAQRFSEQPDLDERDVR